MQIVGAGFARTGTTSMKAALEQLGFGPVHHMSEVKAHPATVHDWLAIVEGRCRDWDRVLGRYRASLDWPAAVYWRELADHYPTAKVVLTVRDAGQWHDSMEKTVFRNVSSSRGIMWHLLPLLSNLRSKDQGAFIRMTRKTVLEGVFGGQVADRARNIRIFEEHNAAVAAAIPADRLLTFDVRQGWEPLCEFLGVPVPDTPFPRLNDRESYRRQGRRPFRMRPLRTSQRYEDGRGSAA